jgi:diguanylate cyclase (GGDEF)-like protein
MTTDSNLLPRLLQLQKTLFSSLRLKDVLDSATVQFSQLTGSGKVAIFLSDNDSLSLKLMTASGYQDGTCEQVRILSFMAESLLKPVVQKRQALTAASAAEAPDISAAIMQREGSKGQIALPLIACNLLVGAVLIDVSDASALGMLNVLKDVADLTALAVANSILFGRSEYERERLGTLYRTSVALSGSSLKVAEVLQITADTALILGNTTHCAVLMFDSQSQTFHVAAFKGLDGNSLSDFDLGVDTVAGRAVLAGKTEYVSDALRYQQSLPRATNGNTFGSLVCVPLTHEHEPLGALMLFATDTRAFHREQVDLLESLAKQASNSLNVALTHESATAQSMQDAHTGLYNRWHFEEALGKELERALRHKRELTLLLVDIDHLSRVNDLLGHEKGDAAIKYVAQIIKNTLRDIDIPCRFGSEEFAIILPETQRQNALEAAERLRQKIRSQPAPTIGMLTVSMGVATYPENGEDGQSLVRAAEQALDIAKFEGRDRTKLADSHNSTGPIPWDELAKQAKLAVVSERQSRLHSGLQPSPDYAPWMHATPGWGKKKTES